MTIQEYFKSIDDLSDEDFIKFMEQMGAPTEKVQEEQKEEKCK